MPKSVRAILIVTGSNAQFTSPPALPGDFTTARGHRSLAARIAIPRQSRGL